MGFSIEIQIEALRDLRDAFDWYEQQREGLGYEFLAEIETCYQKLVVNPEHYSYLNENFRRVKANRFPYLLIYEIPTNGRIPSTDDHLGIPYGK
jgi:plasmid stabilization system protein ParE